MPGRPQLHVRRSERVAGTSGSSQSTASTCSSWTDCERPATAASICGLPRAEREAAAQIRGGTGSAAISAVCSTPSSSTRPPSRPSVTETVCTLPLARERATVLRARRALVADDCGREEPRPRPLADPLALGRDLERAAVVEDAHAASSSTASTESSTAARSVPRSRSPSQSSERPAITFSASSRFESRSASIRSSSVPLQIRLWT